MPQTTPGDLDAQREGIRESLDAISNDIAMEIRDVGLGSISSYLVIPNSGDAIAT